MSATISTLPGATGELMPEKAVLNQWPCLSEEWGAGSGNGYVKAKGLDNKKKSQHLSTADHPFRVIKRFRLLDGFSLIGSAVKVAKETVLGKKR